MLILTTSILHGVRSGKVATPSLLQLLTTFVFNKPEELGKWKHRFQQYHLASGLSAESGERQVSTLLYCMGEGAEDIWEMTAISEDDRKRYDAVTRVLDTHFSNRKQEKVNQQTFHNCFAPSCWKLWVWNYERRNDSWPPCRWDQPSPNASKWKIVKK